MTEHQTAESTPAHPGPDLTTWDHPEIHGLFAKVAKLRAEVVGYVKNATAKLGKYSYDYADVNEILAVIDPHILSLGLCLTQPIIHNRQYALLVDTETGARYCSWLDLEPGRLGPQDLGSKQTYYRRYTLIGLLGLKSTDDDGIAAQQAQRGPSPEQVELKAGSSVISQAKSEPFYETFIAALVEADLLTSERMPPAKVPDGWAAAVEAVRNDPRVFGHKDEVASSVRSAAPQNIEDAEVISSGSAKVLTGMMAGNRKLQSAFAAKFGKPKELPAHKFFEAKAWLEKELEQVED